MSAIRCDSCGAPREKFRCDYCGTVHHIAQPHEGWAGDLNTMSWGDVTSATVYGRDMGLYPMDRRMRRGYWS